jgi:predicted O-methyltransferase YrrM
MYKPEDYTLVKKVDTYIENTFNLNDEVLAFAIKNSKVHNLPPIQITPVIGRHIYLLAKMNQAKRILEIGTLGGYSTLWLAKALPKDGKVVTIEHIEDYATVAKENFVHANMQDVIELRFGKALQILPEMVEKNEPSFDLFFIDAQKEEYPEYVEWAIKLAHPGSIIICDNVIRNGGVLPEQQDKEYYKQLAEFNKKLAIDPRLESTILPTMLPLTDRDYLDGISISIIK